MLRVLYVCRGNILRSPAAERMTNEELERSGLSELITAESAGLEDRSRYLYSWKRMANALKFLGYTHLVHTDPRIITSDDIVSHDLILCMEYRHAARLHNAGALADRTSSITTLHDFADGSSKNVPDPFYGDEKDYLAVAKEIQKCVLSVVPKLRTMI